MEAKKMAENQNQRQEQVNSVEIDEKVTVFKKKYYDQSTQTYKEYLACVITVEGETFELKVNDYDKRAFRFMLKTLYGVEL